MDRFPFETLRCPMCAKPITPYKGRVESHVGAGGRKCLATGMPWGQATSRRRLQDEEAKR